MQDSEVNLGGN